MKYYPIEREEFTAIIIKIFENYDKFIQLFYSSYEGQKFKCWYFDDDFYILCKETGELVNWYKHLGRILEWNLDDRDALEVFLLSLKDEVEEMYPKYFNNKNKEKMPCDYKCLVNKLNKNSIYGITNQNLTYGKESLTNENK